MDKINLYEIIYTVSHYTQPSVSYTQTAYVYASSKEKARASLINRLDHLYMRPHPTMRIKEVEPYDGMVLDY